MERIDPTADAVNRLLEINLNKNGMLALIGDPGTDVIKIQQPAVVSPDVDTDSDWMDMVYDGTTMQLDANNTVLAFPFRGTFRVSKPEGETIGVQYNG